MPGSRWKPSDKVQLASTVLTFVVSVISLGLSGITSRKSEANRREIEASRVETGEVTSNSAGPDFDHPWVPWEAAITTSTTYIGVQRTVVFQQPFRNRPDVTTALTLVNLRPLTDAIADIPAGQLTPAEVRRLREIHLVTGVENETKTGFVLQIGIGLPSEPAKRLKSYLLSHPVSLDVLETMGLYRKRRPGADTPGEGERWVANFYELLGTVDVSWIAQAAER